MTRHQRNSRRVEPTNGANHPSGEGIEAGLRSDAAVRAPLAARTSMAFGRDTRAQVFHGVIDFSAREVSQFGAPTLISRTTNDVQQAQMVVFMTLSMMVGAPIMMIGGVIMALRTDVGLSWLVAVSVPLLALLVGLVLRQMLPRFRVMQDSIDSVNRILREQITGIRVVRAFVREPHEKARFAEANGTLTGASLGVGNLMALVFPLVMLVFNASTVMLAFQRPRPRSTSVSARVISVFRSSIPSGSSVKICERLTSGLFT